MIQSVCTSISDGQPESQAMQISAVVLENVELAHATYRLRLACPGIGQRIKPGQFFMLRPQKYNDPLLGRPFALYDTVVQYSGEAGQDEVIGFDLGYHIVGKMTSLMQTWKPGDVIDVWGPLGNGFPTIKVKHLACVGGGIGYTPFIAVTRQALGLRSYGINGDTDPRIEAEKVSFLYGSRSKSHSADLTDLTAMNVTPMIATDDGTLGYHGFVTDLLKQLLSSNDCPDAVFCCGPEKMMHAVGKICAAANVSCWLSLESPMACGFGACFSCVAKIKQPDGTWDYRRTCIEGPVFPADLLVE
jgi:dihydroorotate dehydrogenase electron transfer subunit